MTESHRQRLNVCRGLLGATVAGVAAVALVLALAFGFLLCRWIVTAATANDRDYDIRDARERLLVPLIGCMTIAGCAGWATFAPAGRYRFAWSMMLIFLITVPLWWIVWSMELTPRRSRKAIHPAIYPSEVLVLIGPPMVVSAVVTFLRLRAERKSEQGPA